MDAILPSAGRVGSPHECAARDGHRDRVRDLGAGPAHGQPDGRLLPGRQRLRAATLRARRARWDFEEESPLRDARGFDMSREIADPSQLTDEDLGLANVILTNGARLYVDHAHPEYSTPECTNPRDVVMWDKAGEQIMLDASPVRARRSPARRRSCSTRTTPTTRARPTAPTRTT